MASIGFGLTCLGCLFLSLSLRRHYRQVFADGTGYESRAWPLRIAGYLALASALWPSARAAGSAPIGIVLWSSMIALAAVLQIVLLTYRPRRAPAFGGFAIALVALGLLL